MGKEVAENARREAIITNRFQHKNIIKIVVVDNSCIFIKKSVCLITISRICV